MCDGEGNLGDPDEAKRQTAVENHHKWVEAAKFLGCHSIRVNAYSAAARQEQMKLAADGLRKLSEFGDKHGINVIVENHGGLSSNGEWLAAAIKMVDHKRAGHAAGLRQLPHQGPGQDNPDAKVESYDSGRRGGDDAARQGRQREAARLGRNGNDAATSICSR